MSFVLKLPVLHEAFRRQFVLTFMLATYSANLISFTIYLQLKNTDYTVFSTFCYLHVAVKYSSQDCR
jgi:hypothetical protein